jgi:hypothetical protein
VSKPWTPGKQTVELRASRIRREPVHLAKAAPPRSREQDIRNAVIGVVALTLISVALVVGVTEITSNRAVGGPAAGETVFGHCHTSGGANCVVDGDTFFLAGERIDIAGIDAPEIKGAACPQERRHGIEAAVTLGQLLNRGGVTLGSSGREAAPGSVAQRSVEVRGHDVGALLVGTGLAREERAGRRSWCEVLTTEE